MKVRVQAPKAGRWAPKAGRHPRPAGSQGRQAGTHGRQAGTQGRQAGRKKTPRHQHTHTPAQLDTRTPVRIPTRTPELVVSNFNLRNKSLKTGIAHKASKETWPEKNQLLVEKKADQPKEQMCHNRQRIAQPHSSHIRRPPKSMHASGTSGPIAPRGDGAENALSSGTSGPIASRDDGAIFLTAAKYYPESVRQGFSPLLGEFLLRTQDTILSQHLVRRNEQTERVCAVNASLIPIRRKANFSQFSKIFEKIFLTLK